MKPLLAALFIVFAGIAANADLIRPPQSQTDHAILVANMRVTSATGQFTGTTDAQVEVRYIGRSLRKYVLLRIGNQFNRGLTTIRMNVEDMFTNRCGSATYTALEQRPSTDVPVVSIDVIDNVQSVCPHQSQIEAKVVRSGGIANIVLGTLALEGALIQSR